MKKPNSTSENHELSLEHFQELTRYIIGGKCQSLNIVKTTKSTGQTQKFRLH